jgi:hypothetical protein
MYRIRRESGEEVNFGSIDELGAAVASGVVTAKAEIFHARAEKWLPIASHPHFKMAHDRINSASAPKAPARAPGLGASGQRPAITAPQASVTAPRPQVPQLRVMRPEASTAAPITAAPTDAAKAAPRWNSAQRPAARAVAPKPSTPSAPPASDLRLVRADNLLSGAATAPALPEVEFELLPVIEEPALVEPVAVEAPAVERSPASVELVSHEEQPAVARGEVEIINPDRTMPVLSNREVPSLEIPEPIRDFAPADVGEAPAVPAKSKAPLFVGIGLVAAAAAVIGFFVMKPSSSAEPTPARTAAAPAPAQQVAEPIAADPAPVSPAVTSMPKGASSGLGGDVQAKKPKKDDTQTASAGSIGDGLEPPPEVLPAAPTLGIGDAAALPTVDAGTIRNDAMARASALEKTRREIDSSMRR